jgi:hypothetical protein
VGVETTPTASEPPSFCGKSDKKAVFIPPPSIPPLKGEGVVSASFQLYAIALPTPLGLTAPNIAAARVLGGAPQGTEQSSGPG